MKKTLTIFLLLLTLHGLKAQIDVGDSLALVDLYNNCNGPNWNRSDNWINGPSPGPVSSWYGINTFNDRVYTLRMIDNNITGALPGSFADLNNLMTLNLSTNSISAIDTITGSLDSLFLDRNQISDLKALEYCTNLSWLNLHSNIISDIKPLVNNPGIGLNNFIELGDNPLSNEAITIDIPALEARGVFVMHNSVAQSEAVNVQDSLALVALYNQCNGPNWNRNDNWLSGPVSSWFGIDVVNTRVRTIELVYNNLTGPLPSELSNLTEFFALIIAGNDSLTDISVLSTLTSITFLNVANTALGDYSVLSFLTNLEELICSGNNITDIKPLVNNTGLGMNDHIDLRDNPLSIEAITIDIPALEARGAIVNWSYVEPNPYPNRIYVSTDGDDAGTGSPADPLQNIGVAIDMASAGDTIVLDEGLHYLDNFQIDQPGITICSHYEFSKDTAVINNTKITTTEGPNYIYNRVKFVGINFINGSTGQHGGALGTGWGSGEIIAENCYFIGNEAEFEGGAVFIAGPGSRGSFRNCVFKYNKALVGSAIQINWGASVEINNCLFYQNHAVENGTISCWDSELSINNCTFYDNYTTGNSNGFYIWDNPEPADIPNVQIRNSIIFNRQKDNVFLNNVTPVIEYSCVRGGFTGEGNIDVFPDFVSTEDLRLRSYSALINAGTPDTTGLGIGPLDLDNEPRVQDGRIDIGCYEGGEDNWPAEEIIAFPDPSLEAKICEELNCTPEQISRPLLETIVTFWPIDCNPPIKDLAGLQYCVNLESLALDGNDVTDLSTITNLTKLHTLYLDRNMVTSLEYLNNLTNLERLSISYNNITSLNGLGSKPKLKRLYANYTNLEDLTEIQEYPSLEILYLTGTPLVSLKDIQNMPNLWALISRHNGMTSVGNFNNVPNLTYLYIAYNNISSLDFLNNLDLVSFEVPYNNISDLSPITSQTNLKTISIHHNPITDISPLASMPNITNLWLENCLISDISPLAGHDSISDLRLNNNFITDLSTLVNMPGLDSLRIANNFLSNKTINDHYPTLRSELIKIDEEQSISDLRFTYPNKSTGVTPGKTIKISWEDYGGTGVAHRINLDYTTDGGTSWSPILTNEVNDSSHLWTIPDLGGQAFLLKIEDAELPTLVRDTSEQVSFCAMEASFTFTKSDLDLTFTNTTTGSPNLFYWDFGDGTSSALENPNHTYPAAGVFQVNLTTVDNATGCNSTFNAEVEAGTVACNAAFDTASITGTHQFSFTDNSTGLIETWHWDFGDNTTSNEQSPSHTYNKDGAYEVCLTVRNTETGYISSECLTIVISTEPDVITPVASFAQIIDHDNLTVELINTTTGDVTNWHWTFDDGTFFDGQETTHTFDEYGTYLVCLYATNEDAGLNSSVCKKLRIGNPPCILQADFSKIVDNGSNTLYLTDASSSDANAWFWNFGDGTTSTAQSPTHTYAAAGKYSVSLTTKNSSTGCTDYISREIMVGSVDCISSFSYGIDMARKKVSFSEKAAGAAEFFFWDFGDGMTSSLADPTHTYDSPGIYTISLTVSDADGLCMDQSSQNIQIQTVECKADFISFIDSTTMTLTLSEKVIGDYSALLWELGDGYSSTLPSFSHTFPAPGYYNVGLTTFNEANGCMDHKEETVLISAPGVDVDASFIYTVDDATNTVTFRNRSAGDNGVFSWNFGDGNTSSETNPVYTYSSGGFYNVCLTAYGDNDKQDTRCKYLRVNPSDVTNCLASFFYMVDSTNLKATFLDNSIGNPNKWLWEFEGSGISELQNPVNEWTQAGYYIIHLRSTNTSTGCFSDAYELINVGAAADGLKTKFDYNISAPSNKKAGHPVDFVGVTIGDHGKYRWDFGDGTSSSTSLRPTHYYSDYGIYMCCLTIENSNTGATNSYCENVLILEPNQNIGIEETETLQQTGHTIALGAYPNPFRDILNIQLYLPESEQVHLAISDLSGRAQKILFNTQKQQGTYLLQWDGTDLDPGIYFVMATTKTLRQVVKIIKTD
jgi:PKD repeat protein/Leucine-rich repeat (LRR) protein